MARIRLVFSIVATIIFLLTWLPENTFGQDSSDNIPGFVRGPGGYLSLPKLAMIAVVYIIWVRMADWINRDSMKFGDKTRMAPELWNPIVVLSLLFGFVLVISVPVFAAGFPIFILTAWAPFLGYFFVRRSRLKANPSLAKQLKLKPGELPSSEALPQDEGVEIDFSPAGADAPAKQASLIRSRQSQGFLPFKELLHLAQFKRAEQLLMDFTRNGAAMRILVDGAWHSLEPMEREPGDQLLESLKFMAGLNPADRRGKQTGNFSFKSDLGKAAISVTSQGVKTGERVQVVFVEASKKPLPFPELGMFPDKVETIKSSLNGAALTIVSAPRGSGLTTSWQGALATADRLTRDCIAIVNPSDNETTLENITVHQYDESAGKKQYEIVRANLLSQPDFVAVPKIEDAETMDLLTLQVTTQDRALLLRTSAKSASDALLKVYAKSGDRNQFLKALHTVTGQRLVRRLCDQCKVEVRVKPEIIKQLGGNPKTQSVIFNQWKLPPPEQRVDEKGNPIEFPPCPACGGIGYIGRIAVFEMIVVNDQLRQFIKKNPKSDAIEKAAVKLGKRPLIQEAYQLVLLGITSMAEVQRVMKET